MARRLKLVDAGRPPGSRRRNRPIRKASCALEQPKSRPALRAFYATDAAILGETRSLLRTAREMTVSLQIRHNRPAVGHYEALADACEKLLETYRYEPCFMANELTSLEQWLASSNGYGIGEPFQLEATTRRAIVAARRRIDGCDRSADKQIAVLRALVDAFTEDGRQHQPQTFRDLRSQLMAMPAGGVVLAPLGVATRQMSEARREMVPMGRRSEGLALRLFEQAVGRCILDWAHHSIALLSDGDVLEPLSDPSTAEERLAMVSEELHRLRTSKNTNEPPSLGLAEQGLLW